MNMHERRAAERVSCTLRSAQHPWCTVCHCYLEPIASYDSVCLDTKCLTSENVSVGGLWKDLCVHLDVHWIHQLHIAEETWCSWFTSDECAVQLLEGCRIINIARSFHPWGKCLTLLSWLNPTSCAMIRLDSNTDDVHACKITFSSFFCSALLCYCLVCTVFIFRNTHFEYTVRYRVYGLRSYLCLVSVDLSCAWLHDSIVMHMVKVHHGFSESDYTRWESIT